jgi:hypothetical protein
LPTIAKEFQHETWRSGPKHGQTKLSPAAEKHA